MKNPVENKQTQWRFVWEPTEDIDSTGSVTELGGVIWATTVKYTQLNKDYETRIVRQGSFEISPSSL